MRSQYIRMAQHQELDWGYVASRNFITQLQSAYEVIYREFPMTSANRNVTKPHKLQPLSVSFVVTHTHTRYDEYADSHDGFYIWGPFINTD